MATAEPVSSEAAFKECTACRRTCALTDFHGQGGKETKQCQRCRDKAKRSQQRPEAKAAKAACNRLNGSSYVKAYKDRVRADEVKGPLLRKKQAMYQAAYVERKNSVANIVVLKSDAE